MIKILVFFAALYLNFAFWGTAAMSIVKPIANKCGVTWKLEKLPLFTGELFCE